MSLVPNTVWVASIKNEWYTEDNWISIHSTKQRAEAALHNKMVQQLEKEMYDGYEIIDPATKRVKKGTSTEKVMQEWDFMTRGDSKWDIEEVAIDANDEVQFVSEKISAVQDAAAAAGAPIKIIGAGQVGSIGE